MRWLRQFVFFGIGPLLSDKTWVKFMYYTHIHKKLDLSNVQSFNEKIQWLKLYDHNPEYVKMVDKYAMKEHVASVVGREYVVPTLGVWDAFDQIDFDCLPDQFVLKCTHDSGGIAICKSKLDFDVQGARKTLTKSLKHNYFWNGREWPYKHVKPRIIAEEYLKQNDPTDKNTSESLVDYKVHCFNGTPEIILVCQNRFVDFREDFYSADWEHLPVSRPRNRNADQPVPKPEQLDQMLAIATKLSEGIPFLRVDLYMIGDRIYVGELTFFPNGGIEPFIPPEFDFELGRMLKLPKKKKSCFPYGL